MKKFVLMLPALVVLAASAQSINPAFRNLKEGKVVYEHIIKMEGRFQRPGDDATERMPKQLTEQFELLFSNRQSLWQSLPDVAEEAAAVSGNTTNTMRVAHWGSGSDVVYQNFETDKRITQRELGAKNYIVEDSIATLAWNVTGETKELLGYTVKKATAHRYGTRLVMGMENGKLQSQELPDTSVIIAWFAPEISVPSGPDYSGQLPGLVLELDENAGRSFYKAIEISSKVTLAAIREPKGGKRISAAAFRTEQQKALQEMRQHMQEGGRVSRPFPSGN